MSQLHVVILAAGQGKRMRSGLPKVLHQIGGQALLAHVVKSAGALEPEAIHVVYGHGGEQVRDALSQMKLHWAEQAERRGTGHAVAQALPAIADDAAVLVLYGDVPLVRPDTLRPVLEAARRGEVGLLSVMLDDPSGYGRIVRDPDGRVRSIVEDKDATADELAIREGNTGILAAPAARLKAWLSEVKDDNAQGEYYLTDVIGLAVSEGETVSVSKAPTPVEVMGVNDRVQLAELERAYQRRRVEELMLGGATLRDPARVDVRGEVNVGQDVTIDVNVILEGKVTLGDGVQVGPNTVIRDATIEAGAKVHANCVIEQAHVGPASQIGPYARLRPGADLADNVRIGNFVEVKNSRFGSGSKSNHLTYIGDTDVGEAVNVGAGTIVCNYDGVNKHRTVIGDRAFIGSGVELVAPVTVREGATIGAGSTITAEAPADKLTVARARQATLDGWRRPVKKG